MERTMLPITQSQTEVKGDEEGKLSELPEIIDLSDEHIAKEVNANSESKTSEVTEQVEASQVDKLVVVEEVEVKPE